MVSLNILFWMLVILFGMIGSMRGWAKEMLVTFGVILSAFLITIMERWVPFINKTIAFEGGATQFWMRTLILLVIIFFAYQTPSLAKLAGSGRFARERLQDTLLGLFLGAVNGYLIFGSIWYWLDFAGYPFPNIVSKPTSEAALVLINLLPPHWLGTPMIYFAVAIAFAFVLVVFI
jgi:uncharacterized membrane protein required for colicin V production